MSKFNRVFTIVLDSCGFGYLPDAAKYDDEGADTIGHIAEKRNGLRYFIIKTSQCYRRILYDNYNISLQKICHKVVAQL